MTWDPAEWVTARQANEILRFSSSTMAMKACRQDKVARKTPAGMTMASGGQWAGGGMGDLAPALELS